MVKSDLSRRNSILKASRQILEPEMEVFSVLFAGACCTVPTPVLTYSVTQELMAAPFQFHCISACLALGPAPCQLLLRTWMSTTSLKLVFEGFCTMETYSMSAKPLELRLLWVLAAILL